MELNSTVSRLTLSEDRLKLAIDSAELGTWYIDAVTREFIPSPRLKELFGYFPEDDMPYSAALSQIPVTHRQMVADAVEAAIAEERPYLLEYPIIGFRDKKVRWVRATGKLFHATESDEGFFSGTIADITQQRLDEQRKNDFISMVSHELKTPLTSVKGYLGLLQMNAGDSKKEEVLESVERSKKQVDRMTSLINGFLDVTRLEFGQLKVDKQTFDMAMLVREMEHDLQNQITTHQLIFAPVEYTPVLGDRDKITQVISNLINNAAKYSPPNSTINIACVTHHNMAVFSVKDMGVGIPKHEQGKLFERFYRVDGNHSKSIGGFGIGLYLAKYIVELHGGTIGVTSNPGAGSTFFFSLPVQVGVEAAQMEMSRE